MCGFSATLGGGVLTDWPNGLKSRISVDILQHIRLILILHFLYCRDGNACDARGFL